MCMLRRRGLGSRDSLLCTVLWYPSPWCRTRDLAHAFPRPAYFLSPVCSCELGVSPVLSDAYVACKKVL